VIVLDGKWHQLLAVYSYPTNQLFVDGIQVVSYGDNHVMTPSDGTRHVWLGATDATYSNPSDVATFKGQIDDVRLYNRALTAKEVEQLYLIGSAPLVTLVKAFTLDYSDLVIGSNYQAQASSDLINWTNWGTAFTASSSTYTNSNYQRIDNWNLFFRLQQQ
jgi:hypothetical protein